MPGAVTSRPTSSSDETSEFSSASGKWLRTVSDLILPTDVVVVDCYDSSTSVDALRGVSNDERSHHFRPMTTTMTFVSRDMRLVVAGLVLLSLTCVTSMVGNGLILARLRRLARQPGKTLGRMNTMVLHLCIADLFVATFNVLPQIGRLSADRFNGNDAMCKMVNYVQVVAMYASSYVLLTTAIDRYLAICHPLR
jgi:hypothetical protein